MIHVRQDSLNHHLVGWNNTALSLIKSKITVESPRKASFLALNYTRHNCYRRPPSVLCDVVHHRLPEKEPQLPSN